MGCGLSSSRVIESMFDAYQANASCEFERLLRALEAAYQAGGEEDGQKSAGLIVCLPGVKRPRTELRVDFASPTRRRECSA